jgi:hypothetical protein
MTNPGMFTAPWDQKLTLVTVVGSTLLLLGAALAAWVALAVVSSGTGRAALLFGGLFSLAALAGSVLLAPRGYTIADGRLTILRLVRPIEIPLASIQAVEPLSAERLNRSLRTLGSGGLFGYYGRFRNAALGDYRMYATRGDGYVLVRAALPYVLTPDFPDRFIEALNRDRGAAGAGRR